MNSDLNFERREYFENSDLGSVCKTTSINLNSGSTLKYGIGCKSDLIVDIKCVPIVEGSLASSAMDVNGINNCQDLYGYLGKSGLRLTDPNITCDLYCDKIDPLVTTTEKSGAHITANPGLALVSCTLLLFLIMSLKRS